MNSTSPTDLRRRLAAAQKHLKLTASQLAAELRITPEWLSKILNDRVAGSADIGLRLDAFLRSKHIEPASILEDEVKTIAVAEAPAPYAASPVAEQILDHVNEVVAAAKGDAARLGWILVQLKEHLAIPKNWRTNEELNQLAHARLRQLQAERDRKERERHPPEQRTEASA